MLKSKLLNRDIIKSIERIVMNMNKDTFVIGRYYDREESRILEWNAEIEEAKKKVRDEAYTSGLSIDEIKKIIEQDK